MIFITQEQQDTLILSTSIYGEQRVLRGRTRPLQKKTQFQQRNPEKQQWSTFIGTTTSSRIVRAPRQQIHQDLSAFRNPIGIVKSTALLVVLTRVKMLCL